MTITTESHGSCAVWAPMADVPRWRDRAACKGKWWLFVVDEKASAAALAVCAGCPVRPECLEDALTRNDPWVEGGMTISQRRREKRRRRREERVSCSHDARRSA